MGDVSSEPTMEEILSSIKRVIEESEAAPGSGSRARRPIRAAVAPPEAEDGDEVLELSNRVAFADAPHIPATPEVSAVRDDDPPQRGSSPRAESILSSTAAEASRGPLEALSRLVVKPDVPGSDTLEALVREMLRPMLRDWLDAKLPGIVETMVAKEIERISGRGM